MARVNTYTVKTPDAADFIYVDSAGGNAAGATITVANLTSYMQTNLSFPGVTAHSALTGLTTGNDHTQYALLAGATFAGAVSGTSFTGSGTVQGSTVASTGNVTGTNITGTGTVQGATVASTGAITATTSVSAVSMTATGTISGATVSGTTVTATNTDFNNLGNGGSAITLADNIAGNSKTITGLSSLAATTVTDGGSRVTVSSTTTVRDIISITQAAYDLLAPPVATTLYLING